MSELDEKTKLRIIIALARFETPPEIVKALREEGIETTLRQIGGYDCSKSYYEAGEKWRSFFEAERKSYIEDVQTVPIANQGFRLNGLQRAYDDAVRRKNFVLAASLMEQAAKEVGGVLTNVRENNNTNRNADLTEEDKRALMADVIQSMMPNPPGTSPAPKAVQ